MPAQQSPWAIRDVRFGKTYWFKTWDELTDWLLDTDDLREVKSEHELRNEKLAVEDCKEQNHGT